MDKLTKSVNARYLELLGREVAFPEDGYLGADIIDTTKRIIARDGDKYLALPEDERLKILGELAYQDKMRELKKDLENFRVDFDVWFSERTLHPDKVNAAIEILKDSGGIYEKDGWRVRNTATIKTAWLFARTASRLILPPTLPITKINSSAALAS